MPKKKPVTDAAPEPRTIEGYDIVALPSAWHQIVGLCTTGAESVWSPLFFARNAQEAKRFLGVVLDESDKPIYDNYDDFAILEPELHHTVPSHVRGLERTYLESNSEATKGKRKALMEARAGMTAETTRRGTRGRRGR